MPCGYKKNKKKKKKNKFFFDIGEYNSLFFIFFMLLLPTGFSLTIVDDNFENGNYTTNPTWIVGAGTWDVNAYCAYEGSYGLGVEASGNISTAPAALKSDTFEFWIRWDNTIGGGDHIDYKVLSANGVEIRLDGTTTNVLFTKTGGVDAVAITTLGSLVAGNWYRGLIEINYYDGNTYGSLYDTNGDRVGDRANIAQAITSVNYVGLSSDKSTCWDNLTYTNEIFDANIISPNNEEITGSYDINFFISTAYQDNTNIKLFVSDNPEDLDTNISPDMNVLNYANITGLNCSGTEFISGEYCQYDWNATNPIFANGTYYIDLNVAHDANSTIYTSNSFTISNMDVNITYPDSSYSNVNQVDYIINGICPSYDVNIYVQSVLSTQTTANNAESKSYTYTPTGSQPYRVDINASCLYLDTNYITDSDTVVYSIDTTPPVIVTYGLESETGFSTIPKDVNAFMQCTDNNSINLDYNIYFNGTQYYYTNIASGTRVETTTDLNSGSYNMLVYCTDSAGNQTSESKTVNFYTPCMSVVDERTNSDFNLDAVTSLIIYDMDNNGYYDLKGGATTKICYSSSEDVLLRCEFIYDNAGTDIFINNHYQTGVMGKAVNSDFNICGFTLEAYYEMIFTSGQERSVVVQNLYDGCFKIGAYTDIAYDEYLMNRLYSIDQLYTLWTYDSNNERIDLGTLDGTQNRTISLDFLIFRMKEYVTSVLQSGLSVNQYDTNTFLIYYDNLKEDNESLTIRIYDGDTVIYIGTEDVNANSFSLMFNITTLTITSDLLKIELTILKEDGSIEIEEMYFDLEGNIGALDPVVAIILSAFLVIFGLTIVASRFALGWFGIIVIIVGMALTVAAQPTWYLTLWQVGLVIGLTYIILVYKGDTVRVV